MSPVGKSKPYVENPDYTPNPLAMFGTFETSGTSGAAQYDYDAVVGVFKKASDQDAEDKPEDAPVEEVPSSDSGDQIVLTGTLDTSGAGAPESPQAPTVEASDDEPVSVGGSQIEGAGADDAETQGTVDTTGTDEPTSPSAEITPNATNEGDEDEAAEAFSPVGRTVDAVNKYLEKADEDERARVLLIEAEGSNRKGIVEGPYAL